MYTVKIHPTSRYLRIRIQPGGEVVVTVPKNVNSSVIEKFLQDKNDWIQKKVKLMEQYPKTTKVTLSRKEVAALKIKALSFAQERLAYFNEKYGYKWNTVTIRKQKTRWGSCSRKGNLNFNYKIALLPKRLADYIVVHELCHLGEFNHSDKFWTLVARTIPDYKERRKELKTKGIEFQ
jgi:predicted metal-dependent hydrolase